MLLIIGFIMVILGLPLMLIGLRSRRRYKAFRATSTIPVEEAKQTAEQSGKAAVELKGTAQSDGPLVSPATETPCLYYRHKVRQRIESWERGLRRHRWATVWDKKHSVPFLLRDAGGTVEVDPEGAKFIAKQTLDHAEGAPGYDPFGEDRGLKEDIEEILTKIAPEKGLDNYQTSEWLIPIGEEVYVLGEIATFEGGVKVGRGKKPFVISLMPEEELTRKNRRGYIIFILGAISFPLGVVLVALTLL